MGTQYGDTPLRDFQIGQISELETGYYYYEFVHAKGYKIVMREAENEREYLYAEGTFAKRTSLSYDSYDKLFVK